MRIDSPTNASLPIGQTEGPTELRDEFLNLLVAQLEHQNPLEPTEGSEFVAQLAQLTSVEQSAEGNRRLAAIEAQQASAAGAAMAGFVGSKAIATAGAFRWNADHGAAPDFSFDLDGKAESVTANIYDGAGNVVKTFDMGAHGAGSVDLTWDGTNNTGVPLPPGDYRIGVEATAKDGSKIPVTAQLSGVVTAVEFSGGQQLLRLGGASIAPSDILSIGKQE